MGGEEYAYILNVFFLRGTGQIEKLKVSSTGENRTKREKLKVSSTVENVKNAVSSTGGYNVKNQSLQYRAKSTLIIIHVYR